MAPFRSNALVSVTSRVIQNPRQAGPPITREQQQPILGKRVDDRVDREIVMHGSGTDGITHQVEGTIQAT